MITFEVFRGSSEEWDRIIDSAGTSYYQSYHWGEHTKQNGWTPLRLLVYKSKSILFALSLLVKGNKFLKVIWIPGLSVKYIEYIGNEFDIFVKDQIKFAFCYFKISLFDSADISNKIKLENNHWKKSNNVVGATQSLIYKIDGTQDERLKLATANWRHNLKRSHRYNLDVVKWTNPDAKSIYGIYAEMQSYKQLNEQFTFAEIESLLRNMSDSIIIVKCSNEFGDLVSVRGVLIRGENAYDIIAATTPEGRKVYSSYQTIWFLISLCQGLGVKNYDLGGVNRDSNKGVYDFKKGLGSTLIEYEGEWDKFSSPIIEFIVNIAFYIRRVRLMLVRN